jgi:hypothetical protein
MVSNSENSIGKLLLWLIIAIVVTDLFVIIAVRFWLQIPVNWQIVFIINLAQVGGGLFGRFLRYLKHRT